MINILGIILVFSAVIGFIGAICIDRQAIHVLYTTIILIDFIYQIATAVIVYDQAAHTSSWLSQTWSDASQEYRLYAQFKVVFTNTVHLLPAVRDIKKWAYLLKVYLLRIFSCQRSSSTRSNLPTRRPCQLGTSLLQAPELLRTTETSDRIHCTFRRSKYRTPRPFQCHYTLVFAVHW